MNILQISVVLASDNNYIFPTCVTLVSLFESASPSTKYAVHILLSDNVTEKDIAYFETVQEQYKRHDIFLYNMGDLYKDAFIAIDHVSYATYYRLMLPELFPNLDKCIYLDADTIVNHDLSEFYQIDISECYIAGVRAAGYYSSEARIAKVLKELSIPSIDQYVNAGVLLINLKAICEEDLKKTFDMLVDKRFSSQDQDIFNVACYGRIKILPFRYNVMTKYFPLSPEEYSSKKGLVAAYPQEEWLEGCTDPVIVHYADKKKPWIDLTIDYSELWWETAAKLPFFADILDQYYPEIFENAHQTITLLRKLKRDKKGQKEKLRSTRAENKRLNKENNLLKKKIIKKDKKYNTVLKSKSYKIGRAITAPIRKMKGK